MNALDNEAVATADLYAITASFEVLFEDVLPILFTGVNSYGTRMVGSSVDDDADRGISRFLHVYAAEDAYVSFRKGRLTYLSLIERATSVFLVDRYHDGREPVARVLKVSQLPVDYLPSEDSWCPDDKLIHGSAFETALVGGIADEHLADSKEIGTVQTILAGVIGDPGACIGRPQRLLSSPSAIGSFALSFEVRPVESQISMFENQYEQYQRLYLDFCLGDGSEELGHIDGGESVPRFEELLKLHEAIAGRGKKSDSGRETLVTSLRATLDRLLQLSSMVGGNFAAIEVRERGGSSNELIGTINREELERIAVTAEKYDTDHASKIEEDQNPTEYSVYIYSLNTETRKGNAYIVRDNQNLSRVRFSIAGDISLEETIYTRSLSTGDAITVQGKARRVDGALKSLVIVPSDATH